MAFNFMHSRTDSRGGAGGNIKEKTSETPRDSAPTATASTSQTVAAPSDAVAE